MIDRNDRPPPLFAPVDPNVRKEDAPRLEGQNKTVLAMLRRGPVTQVGAIQYGILRLGAPGISTRAIERKVGVSRTTVARVLREAGMARKWS